MAGQLLKVVPGNASGTVTPARAKAASTGSGTDSKAMGRPDAAALRLALTANWTKVMSAVSTALQSKVRPWPLARVLRLLVTISAIPRIVQSVGSAIDAEVATEWVTSFAM
nr:hypothetical protein [Bosea sp. BH3]